MENLSTNQILDLIDSVKEKEFYSNVKGNL